jgi:hypothetical protein
MNIKNHKNIENIIRYYLSFLPPAETKNIIDIGAGVSTPYRGVLSSRCEIYKSLDIRSDESNKIDYIHDLTKKSIFKDNEFEWGWCSETIEHIQQIDQLKFIKEVSRICENVVITFPTPLHQSFHDDPGHIEVIIDFNNLNDKFIVIDKTTKTGRCIFIMLNKEKYSGIQMIKNKMIINKL